MVVADKCRWMCDSSVNYTRKINKNTLIQESEAEIEDEVDILMSSDIVAAQMSTKNISFSRAQSGWLFKEDKSVS